MAIRRILRMGHPLLRERARPLAHGDVGPEALDSLLTDMIDTLHDYGGIGLAAPQIGERPYEVELLALDVPPQDIDGGRLLAGDQNDFGFAVAVEIAAGQPHDLVAVGGRFTPGRNEPQPLVVETNHAVRVSCRPRHGEARAVVR